MSNDEKCQAQERIDDAVQQLPEPPKKGCRSGCRRGCLIFVLIFAFPLWWNSCHTTPMRFSHETTRVLGPMTTDGKRIDYFRAYEEKYYPPEMKTDDNGYRLIVQALGCSPERSKNTYDPKTGTTESVRMDAEPFRRQIYEKLGLDPDVPPTMFSDIKEWASYVPIREELERRRKENPDAKKDDSKLYEEVRETFWTLEDHPFMEDWLKRSGPALDLIGQAVRKPTFKVPYTRENENTPIAGCLVPSEEFLVAREWARTLLTRIRYRLGTGDIDGAIDDTITCHRLARHVGRHGTLAACLFGVALEGVATAVGIAENPKYPPTKAQILRFLTELNKLPPRMTMSEAIEAERLYGLASLQDMYWRNAPKFSGGPLPEKIYPLLGWIVDINMMMERMNHIYDSLIDQTSLADEVLASSPFRPYRLISVKSRSLQMMDMFATLLIPGIQACRNADQRCECLSNMQRLTLALLLYEIDHKKMPEGDWREAIKPYLGPDADKYWHCPAHLTETDETTYVMISGVDNSQPTPQQILIVEVVQPQKLGEGNGRFPLEKSKLWGKVPLLPSDQRPKNFDGLGSYHTGGLQCGFRNGSVRFILETIEPKDFNQLLDGTATRIP